MELSFTDLDKIQVFTFDDAQNFSLGETEILVDEVTRMESPEMIYSDKLVKVLFAESGLTDPRIFNEQVLEECQLGSFASYRNKTMVSRTIVT